MEPTRKFPTRPTCTGGCGRSFPFASTMGDKPMMVLPLSADKYKTLEEALKVVHCQFCHKEIFAEFADSDHAYRHLLILLGLLEPKPKLASVSPTLVERPRTTRGRERTPTLAKGDTRAQGSKPMASQGHGLLGELEGMDLPESLPRIVQPELVVELPEFAPRSASMRGGRSNPLLPAICTGVGATVGDVVGNALAPMRAAIKAADKARRKAEQEAREALRLARLAAELAERRSIAARFAGIMGGIKRFVRKFTETEGKVDNPLGVLGELAVRIERAVKVDPSGRDMMEILALAGNSPATLRSRHFGAVCDQVADGLDVQLRLFFDAGDLSGSVRALLDVEPDIIRDRVFLVVKGRLVQSLAAIREDAGDQDVSQRVEDFIALAAYLPLIDSNGRDLVEILTLLETSYEKLAELSTGTKLNVSGEPDPEGGSGKLVTRESEIDKRGLVESTIDGDGGEVKVMRRKSCLPDPRESLGEPKPPKPNVVYPHNGRYGSTCWLRFRDDRHAIQAMVDGKLTTVMGVGMYARMEMVDGQWVYHPRHKGIEYDHPMVRIEGDRFITLDEAKSRVDDLKLQLAVECMSLPVIWFGLEVLEEPHDNARAFVQVLESWSEGKLSLKACATGVTTDGVGDQESAHV